MGARGMGTETLPNLSLATCGAAREVKTWPRQQPKSESLLDGGLQLRAKPSGSSLAKGQNLPIVSELRQLTQQLQPPAPFFAIGSKPVLRVSRQAVIDLELSHFFAERRQNGNNEGTIAIGTSAKFATEGMQRDSLECSSAKPLGAAHFLVKQSFRQRQRDFLPI